METLSQVPQAGGGDGNILKRQQSSTDIESEQAGLHSVKMLLKAQNKGVGTCNHFPGVRQVTIGKVTSRTHARHPCDLNSTSVSTGLEFFTSVICLPLSPEILVKNSLGA